MPRTYWRPITVEGIPYLWYVTGSKQTIVREARKGSPKHVFVTPDVLAMQQEDERNPEAWMDREYGASVTPGEVAAWIRSELLRLPPAPSRPSRTTGRAWVDHRPRPWRHAEDEDGGFAVVLRLERIADDGTRKGETRVLSLHADPATAKEKAAELDRYLANANHALARIPRRRSGWMAPANRLDWAEGPEAAELRTAMKSLMEDPSLVGIRVAAMLRSTAEVEAVLADEPARPRRPEPGAGGRSQLEARG